MSTDELFNRYAEETDILSDEKSLLVILYGSRITDEYKDSSDLDVLVVVPGEDGYFHKEKRFIDGIPVETFFMSKSTLMRRIAEEYWIDSKFLESVITTGVVKKDMNDIGTDALKEINRLKEFKKEKQGLSKHWEEELDKILFKYHKAKGNEKQLYYFKFINALRIIYHYMNNYSNVTDWKFYKIYTNKEKANLYKLDLPDDEFIEAMISAINPSDMDESLESLFPFIGYTDYMSNNREVFIEEEWRRVLSKFDTEKKLMYLGKNVSTVEDKLLTESADANCCYFLLLDYIDNEIWYIGPKDRTEFDEVFKRAVDTVGIEERIRVIEELLHILENGYKFDYDDYSL